MWQAEAEGEAHMLALCLKCSRTMSRGKGLIPTTKIGNADAQLFGSWSLSPAYATNLVGRLWCELVDLRRKHR